MRSEREFNKMLDQARQNLAAPTSDKDAQADAQCNLISAILEDENKKKDVYEFIVDDDDFEVIQIENDASNDDQMMIDAYFKIQNNYQLLKESQSSLNKVKIYQMKKQIRKQKTID